jgi:dCTP deaminase
MVMTEASKSLMSEEAILGQLGRGVIIDPFKRKNLGNCSYDVCLGEYYYRRRGPSWLSLFRSFSLRSLGIEDVPIFNPYSPRSVKEHFEGPFRAKRAADHQIYNPKSEVWENIEPDDLIILIYPGELILGHTVEFIGGTRDPDTGRCFTAEMKARSSVGRSGLEVCRCAGWGDVGYVNRWTMEIKNDDTKAVPLVVGGRLAQMKFYEVDPVRLERLYGAGSCNHYQRGCDLEEIKGSWQPEMLKPRLTK